MTLLYSFFFFGQDRPISFPFSAILGEKTFITNLPSLFWCMSPQKSRSFFVCYCCCLSDEPGYFDSFHDANINSSLSVIFGGICDFNKHVVISSSK